MLYKYSKNKYARVDVIQNVSSTMRLVKGTPEFQNPVKLLDTDFTGKEMEGKITLKTMSKGKEKAKLGSL